MEEPVIAARDDGFRSPTSGQLTGNLYLSRTSGPAWQRGPVVLRFYRHNGSLNEDAFLIGSPHAHNLSQLGEAQRREGEQKEDRKEREQQERWAVALRPFDGVQDGIARQPADLDPVAWLRQSSTGSSHKPRMRRGTQLWSPTRTCRRLTVQQHRRGPVHLLLRQRAPQPVLLGSSASLACGSVLMIERGVLRRAELSGWPEAAWSLEWRCEGAFPAETPFEGDERESLRFRWRTFRC